MRHFGAFLETLFQRVLAAEDFVFVTVGELRRIACFAEVSGDVENLEFHHIVQVLYLDEPFRSVDGTLVVGGGDHRFLEIGALSVFVGEVYPVACVDASLEQYGLGFGLHDCIVFTGDLRIGEEEVREGQAVDAQVQERAACESRVVQAFDMRKRHGEIGLDGFHLANPAGDNPVLEGLYCRQEARPHGFA